MQPLLGGPCLLAEAPWDSKQILGREEKDTAENSGSSFRPALPQGAGSGSRDHRVE